MCSSMIHSRSAAIHRGWLFFSLRYLESTTMTTPRRFTEIPFEEIPIPFQPIYNPWPHLKRLFLTQSLEVGFQMPSTGKF